MNYRNPRILALAQDHSCQACGQDNQTTVAAHSNSQAHGKGLGIKSHDCFVGFCCSDCHYFIDFSPRADRSTRESLWQIAHTNSIPLFRHLLNARGLDLLGMT